MATTYSLYEFSNRCRQESGENFVKISDFEGYLLINFPTLYTFW